MDNRALESLTKLRTVLEAEDAEDKALTEAMEPASKALDDLLELTGFQVEADSLEEAYEIVGEILEDEELSDADRAYVESIGSKLRRAVYHVARTVGAVQGYHKRAKRKWKQLKRMAKWGHQSGLKAGEWGSSKASKSKPKRKAGAKKSGKTLKSGEKMVFGTVRKVKPGSAPAMAN